MQRKSTSKAIIEGKCPRCRQGDVFTFPISNITKFATMNKQCPKCGVMFEVEPGFFFGAMYVSYAMTVGLLLFIGLLLYISGIQTLWVYFVSVLATVLILLPVIFRYSRILFLHWFGGITYDESYL